MERQPRGIEALVDAQVRRWLASQAAKAEGGATASELALPPAPITLSREFGAQGERLARMLAERMGFTCWDAELLSAIAKSTQAHPRLLEALDERRRSGIERFVELWRPFWVPGDQDYLRALVRAVHAIAAQGSAIIVGRGSQLILSPAEALHVRVIAPLEHRVQGLMTRRGWTEAQARAEIARMDDERVAFQRVSFGRDPTDPHLYDLVLNVGQLSLERAAEVLEAAWKAKFRRS